MLIRMEKLGKLFVILLPLFNYISLKDSNILNNFCYDHSKLSWYHCCP